MTFQTRAIIFHNKSFIIRIFSIFVRIGESLFPEFFFAQRDTGLLTVYLTFCHFASMTRFTVSPIDPVILTLYTRYSDTAVLKR